MLPDNGNYIGGTIPLSYTDFIATKIAMELDLEERWHIFVKRTEDTERKFKPKLVALFSRQERDVLRRMRRLPVPTIGKASEEAVAAAESYVDELFQIADWQKLFETVALPFVTEAFAEAGQAAFVEIGLEASFNVTNVLAREILRTRVFKFAEDVNDTTKARLRTALATGFDAGESIPELSQRVADVFDIAKGSRTDTIARTEIVGASNQGTFQGFVDSDVVEKKVWINSRDNLVRSSPHNHRIDGQKRKLQAKFSNGLLHPHDPNGAAGNVINCRCTLGASKLKEAA